MTPLPSSNTDVSQEDHDNVPDTGSNAASSVANDSGTSDSSLALPLCEAVAHLCQIAAKADHCCNPGIPVLYVLSHLMQQSAPSVLPSLTSADNSMTVRQFHRECRACIDTLRVQEMWGSRKTWFKYWRLWLNWNTSKSQMSPKLGPSGYPQGSQETDWGHPVMRKVKLLERGFDTRHDRWKERRGKENET